MADLAEFAQLDIDRFPLQKQVPRPVIDQLSREILVPEIFSATPELATSEVLAWPKIREPPIVD